MPKSAGYVIKGESGMSETGDAYAKIAASARASSLGMQAIPHAIRSGALLAMAKALRSNQQNILNENDKDCQTAQGEGALSASFVKRLRLDPQKIEGMAVGLESLD
jgi:glutamate-5-semialdehyde dehydrogenase